MPYKLTSVWPEVVTLHIGEGKETRSVGLAPGNSMYVEKLSPVMETLKDKHRITVSAASAEEIGQEAAAKLRAADHRDIIHLKKKVALGQVPKEVLMQRLSPGTAPQVSPEPKASRKPREDKTT